MAEEKKGDPLILVAGCLALVLACAVCGGGGAYAYQRAAVEVTVFQIDIICRLPYDTELCADYAEYIDTNYPNVYQQCFWSAPFSIDSRSSCVTSRSISPFEYSDIWEAQNTQ